MKILIGYYDKNGRYIGKALDDPSRDKYFILMGTYRKKIAEHEHQSPYKWSQVQRYTKTYCDENRINVYVDVYINGKLSETYTNLNNYWYWTRDAQKELYETLKTICKHAKNNLQVDLIQKYNIDERRIYYPVYFY